MTHTERLQKIRSFDAEETGADPDCRDCGDDPPHPERALWSRREPGGVYETCELLAGSGIENLLLWLRAVPAVPVARHKDGPLVMDAAHRALLRAGCSLDQ
jgi:hypothetical protein